MEKHTVILDAESDLNNAGLCNCSACCDEFSRRFVEAAGHLGESLDIEIGVVRTRYGSPESFELERDPDNLWQRIHDSTPWSKTDAVCGE